MRTPRDVLALYPWFHSISWCLVEGYRNEDQRRTTDACVSGRTLSFLRYWWQFTSFSWLLASAGHWRCQHWSCGSSIDFGVLGYFCFLQCFDAVGWETGRAPGLSKLAPQIQKVCFWMIWPPEKNLSGCRKTESDSSCFFVTSKPLSSECSRRILLITRHTRQSLLLALDQSGNLTWSGKWSLLTMICSQSCCLNSL